MRSFVNVSWNNASDVYDGSQQQNRHFNPNGTAAIHVYEDETPKVKVKQSIRYKIVPQQRRLENIEQMVQDLDTEYAEGGMSAREYAELSLVLEKKHQRAYELLSKAMGWKDELSQDEPSDKDEAPVQSNAWVSLGGKTSTKCEKDSIFLTLPVDNVFRRCYTAITQAKAALNSLKGK